MPRYQDQVFDEYGRPVPNATVWVFTAIGDTATLTDDLGLPLANPVETDPWGNFYFNCADGYYELNIHWGGEVRYKQTILVGLVPGAVLDGDHGDITVTNLGITWIINPAVVTGPKLADGAVTTAKLADGNVTQAKQAPVASATVFYRKSAGAGSPEVQPLATLKTDLGLAGINTGDQTITLTGAVTGSGTGNIVAAIAPSAVGTLEIANFAVTSSKIAGDAVTFAQLQNIITNSILGRSSAGTGNTEELLPATVAGMLPTFTDAAKGLAPASGGGTVNFLRADGTWANPAGGVTSFNTRVGAVTLLSTDVTGALGYTPAPNVLFSTSAPGMAPQSPGGNTTYLRADGAWAIPATDVGTVAWGAITGTLSNQTDLQTALNGKANLAGGNAFTDNQTIAGSLTVSSSVTATGLGAFSGGVRINADGNGLLEIGRYNSAGITFAIIRPGTTAINLTLRSPDNANQIVIANAGVNFPLSPTVPNVVAGDNTTKAANTAFVQAALAGLAPGGVTSFNTRTGAITLTSGDVTTALTFTPLKAADPIASLNFSATARIAGRTAAGAGAAQELTIPQLQAMASPRIQSVASAATVTPAFTDDQVDITAQAVALNLANPTGTAMDGYGISIRIKDNGTAQAIAYGSQYRAFSVPLPTTTTPGKTMYIGCVWNAADIRFDVVSVAMET